MFELRSNLNLTLCVVWLLLFPVVMQVADCQAAPPVDFSREILPIFSENCFYCHGPDAARRKGKLRLDDEADAKRDRKGERAIIPQNSADSVIMARLHSTDPDEHMPPADSHKQLRPQQIELIKRWIDEGAHWGQHWSFTKLARPQVPALGRSSGVRNPIDAFVLDRLTREKLKPSPEADRVTLIRRVTLDLTGLPPTIEEVKAFLNDRATNSFEKVVDRLLASPAYGERMAWDWMEVSRYADSNGYQGDAERTMWPWRDWVIKAFNQNMPYDKFTIWQLAGDLLPDAKMEQKVATAFCRNYPINGEGGRIAEENRVDYVMDMTETTATVWLGLTFNCTRCHDHKFDPFTRRDYYSLSAFFNQSAVDGKGRGAQTKPVVEMIAPDDAQKLGQLKEATRLVADKVEKLEKENFALPAEAGATGTVTNLPDSIKDILKEPVLDREKEEFVTLEKKFETALPDYAKILHELQASLKEREDFSRSLPRVMVMQKDQAPRDTFILERGLYNKPGEKVNCDTPARLPALPTDAPRSRLGLAEWIVSPENPLTPRVTANRIWQMFFGMGLVKTSEDFGSKGEYPSNPDLLDWLAAEFRDSGWDVKNLVRLIVTSRTYRQSSRATDVLRERDPENRLLARGPRFRMPSWMIRDQALAASGLLNRKIGGPSVRPYQPGGVWEEATFGEKKYKQDTGDLLYRRSLYIFWRRIVGPTELFDTAPRMVCTVKPNRNNTPLHALITLNDTTYVEAARKLAERTMLATPDTRKRVETAFQMVLARKPRRLEEQTLMAEFKRANDWYSGHRTDADQLLGVGDSLPNQSLPSPELAAWTTTCLAMLNLDETLTKE